MARRRASRKTSDGVQSAAFVSRQQFSGVHLRHSPKFMRCTFSATTVCAIRETAMAIHRWFEDYVFEVSDFLPSDRCDALIAQAERHRFEEATVNTAGGHRRRENLRNNDRVISDDDKLSAELWVSVAAYVPRI